MTKPNAFMIACLTASLGWCSVPSAEAQIKVFLGSAQQQFAPREIVEDAEFTDEKAEDTEVAPLAAGRLKFDVAPGAIVQVPVFVIDGEEDVVSYAFRVIYNKNVLKLVAINGGTYAGFAQEPLTNPALFATGATDFTALTSLFQPTPDNFHVASVTFEVIGKRGQRGVIALRKTPKADLTILDPFGPARQVQFQKGITVRVK